MQLEDPSYLPKRDSRCIETGQWRVRAFLQLIDQELGGKTAFLWWWDWYAKKLF
jgi:hypothetical protein